MDTKTAIDYRDDKGKMEINYKDKNETDYKDLEDINLEITCNNTLLPHL